MKTLEQLNELSDYAINCAVAEKMGHDPEHEHRHYNPKLNDAMWYEGKTYHSADYCNTPNDYMPIAIEHKINITHSMYPGREDVTVMYMHPFGTPLDIVKRDRAEITVPCEQTGRAVCIAFLLIRAEGVSND